MRKFVCILFGVLFLIAASAAGTWATEAFSIYNIPPDHSAAAAKYWTAERMQNAIPRPTPRKTATPLQSSTGTLRPSTDTPGYDPSYDPRQKGCQTSVLLPDDEAGSLSTMTDNASIGYNYPPPHTTFYVLSSLYGTNFTPFPYKAIGKVFFTGDRRRGLCVFGCRHRWASRFDGGTLPIGRERNLLHQVDLRSSLP